jgi:aromatic ring-opening dioxygenase catalytic subunit (LigB family)
MNDPFRSMFTQLEASLVELRERLPERPRAVLVVTGHWESPDFAVSTGAKPGMVYDYSGFPEFTYRLKYEAPGSPEIAARVLELLKAGGLASHGDETRGFDHGTFSMLKPIYPDADVPVVQLSINASYDPEVHLKAGRLLAPLRDEGVLLLGSGSSYHNLGLWNTRGAAPSKMFDDWLQQTLVHTPAAERSARLKQWTTAPAARLAQPREDHLVPLMVAVGAAESEAGSCIYHEDKFAGAISLSSFRFGSRD